MTSLSRPGAWRQPLVVTSFAQHVLWRHAVHFQPKSSWAIVCQECPTVKTWLAGKAANHVCACCACCANCAAANVTEAHTENLPPSLTHSFPLWFGSHLENVPDGPSTRGYGDIYTQEIYNIMVGCPSWKLVTFFGWPIFKAPKNRKNVSFFKPMCYSSRPPFIKMSLL